MTAALIIAAGKRSGRSPFSPGRKIGSISAITRIVLLLQQAGIRKIAVCGEEEEVKKLVPSMNLVFLAAPEDGQMLCCIQKGIAYLQQEADQILVCPVDVPLFSTKTLSALLTAGGTVCIPSYKEKHGHPVLLRKECFPGILRYQGNGGLRRAMESCGVDRTIVEVEDPGIFSGAEEGELLPNHDIGKLRLSFKLRIGKEEVFYGPGVHQLLLLTQQQNSLAEACKYMGISYSKGRKIIQTMEQQLGTPVLITRQGGKGGGCSLLTDRAKTIMAQYDALQEEAEEVLQKLFVKHFGIE